jgi:hypothetical protein
MPARFVIMIRTNGEFRVLKRLGIPKKKTLPDNDENERENKKKNLGHKIIFPNIYMAYYFCLRQ